MKPRTFFALLLILLPVLSRGQEPEAESSFSLLHQEDAEQDARHAALHELAKGQNGTFRIAELIFSNPPRETLRLLFLQDPALPPVPMNRNLQNTFLKLFRSETISHSSFEYKFWVDHGYVRQAADLHLRYEEQIPGMWCQGWRPEFMLTRVAALRPLLSERGRRIHPEVRDDLIRRLTAPALPALEDVFVTDTAAPVWRDYIILLLRDAAERRDIVAWEKRMDFAFDALAGFPYRTPEILDLFADELVFEALAATEEPELRSYVRTKLLNLLTEHPEDPRFLQAMARFHAMSGDSAGILELTRRLLSQSGLSSDVLSRNISMLHPFLGDPDLRTVYRDMIRAVKTEGWGNETLELLFAVCVRLGFEEELAAHLRAVTEFRYPRAEFWTHALAIDQAHFRKDWAGVVSLLPALAESEKRRAGDAARDQMPAPTLLASRIFEAAIRDGGLASATALINELERDLPRQNPLKSAARNILIPHRLGWPSRGDPPFPLPRHANEERILASLQTGWNPAPDLSLHPLRDQLGANLSALREAEPPVASLLEKRMSLLESLGYHTPEQMEAERALAREFADKLHRNYTQRLDTLLVKLRPQWLSDLYEWPEEIWMHRPSYQFPPPH